MLPSEVETQGRAEEKGRPPALQRGVEAIQNIASDRLLNSVKNTLQ